MSDKAVKESRALRSMLSQDKIFEPIHEFKKQMQETLSEEDAKMADDYFDEIAKGITPVIEKVNQVLSNEGTRTLLMDSVKQALKDEEWLEKLSKTSYQQLLQPKK